MDMKTILDEARRSLLVVDMRSPTLNFTSWKRTLAVNSVTSTEKHWVVTKGDRRARHDVREALKAGRLTIFTDLVWYDLDDDGVMLRCGALTTIPATVDEDCAFAVEAGPQVDNQPLIDLLATLGTIAVRTPEGFQLSGSGALRAKLDPQSRLGSMIPEHQTAAAYLDHSAYPAILRSPLLRLFVEHPLLRAQADLDPDLFKGASPNPASERPDKVEASEPRSKAVSDHEVSPASECTDVVGPSERRPDADLATAHPLDPDQAEAVRLAMAGTSIIIDGPPGTGKSQVIAALAERVTASGLRAIITSTETSAIEVARRRVGPLATDPALLIADIDQIAAHRPPCIGEPDFDLLIIDECSRLPMEKALPLLVRAKAAIIIGDDRQMRPDTDGETMLDRATAIKLRRVTLRFHYRSRDPSLIGPSNLLAYEMALRTVPTPDRQRSNGLKLIDLPNGKESRTASGTVNKAEAAAVVAKLKELRASGDNRSIGIVCANYAQQQLVRKLTIEAGFKPDTRNAAEIEPLFVRTIQNVQGEERDVVLVTTTYDGRGKPERFGGFDEGGAIERLNVMLSRSRYEMWIFTSFRRSTPRHSPTPGSGRIAFEAMRIFIDKMTQAETRLPVPVEIQGSARRLRLTVERLGVVYGFMRQLGPRYDIGLVVTDDTKTAPHWKAIVQQLKAVGWTVAEIDKDELRARPTAADAVLRVAMATALEAAP